MTADGRPRRAPAHLSDRGRALWREIAGGWELDQAQYELLRRLVEASDRADEARALIAAEGLTTTDRYGQVKPHPAVNIERDARIAVTRIMRELNLAPDIEEPRPPRLGRRS